MIYIAAIILIILLPGSCAKNRSSAPPEESGSSAGALDPDTDTDTDPDAALDPVPRQLRKISPPVDGTGWTLIYDMLWYLNEDGIHFLDIATGADTKVNEQNVFNTMFVFDDSIWFAHNYLWGTGIIGLQEDQIPLARLDLVSGQYHEYPTDAFTGVDAAVLKPLSNLMICAGGKLYEYDKENDRLIARPEYGEDIWRIAGNEEVLAIYTGVYTGDSLEIYRANGETAQYDPESCLPDNYVTAMHVAGDELFVCWGGEGPSGIACLDLQGGAWTHYVDGVLSTPHEYTFIYGYGGEILLRENDTVYLPLMNAQPSSLLEFSFQQRQFECIYTSENSIYNAIPFRDGIIIYQYPELIYLDADNKIETIMEDIVVHELIMKGAGAVLAITDQGIFECKSAN